jgi:hypothetical protein
MPPKKAPKVKKPRLGRAGRAAPERKKSQKLKQIQKVNVQVTSGGGGGGSTAPMPFIPQQFRDTSGENIQLMNLVKSVSDNLARGNILGKAPTPDFVAPEVAPNPANDSATTEAVFNAPINNNDTIPEQILREEDNLPSEGKRRRKKKPILILEEQLDMPEPISIMEDIKKKRGPQKGVKYGSTKEKYKQVGFQEGVPAGRNIQNEMVMAVEQMQNRKILPGQFTIQPPAPPAMEAPIQSSSSSDINFA